MADPTTPLEAVGNVRSEVVLAAPHSVQIAESAKIPTRQRRNLTDVLLRAKQVCLGVNCPAPTAKEMDCFLVDVFDMWASGEYHALPDANSVTTGMKDKTVAIGTLDEDVPSNDEIKAELKRRGVSS